MAEAAVKKNWWSAFTAYLTPRMLIIVAMGFASGLPLLLTLSTLSYWLSKLGVDKTTIGLFALVGYISHCITDQPMGVHITPLSRTTNRRDGNRSVFGHMLGGVIRLVDGPDPLVLGEGVETTLSGYAITQAGSAWCALSAENLAQIRAPLGILDIGLLLGRDRAGETACRWACHRLKNADPRRRIRAHWPELPHNDFNGQAGGRP